MQGRDNVYSCMTKPLALLAAFFYFPLVVFCQKNKIRQQPTFGVHFVLNDFKTAANIRSGSLSTTLREGKFGSIKDMSPGIALNFIQGLSSRFDVTSTLAGSFLDYPRYDTVYSGEKKLLVEADVSVRAKLFDNSFWISPYLQLGAGLSKYKGYWGALVPAGAGLQVNITGELYLLINAQYRFPVTENTTSRHFYYSIGVAGIFGKKLKSNPQRAELPRPAINPPTDRDGDGIVDSSDLCPDQPGMAMFQGCPDKDNDSIPDKDDQCPAVYGLSRYKGCPVPDQDGDGINDEEDRCLTVPGIVKYVGCPQPDRDKDGVEDENDQCPDLAGTSSTNGCPEEVKKDVQATIDKAAKNIFFATNSYRLLAVSNAALDEVAKILSDNPNLKVNIEGHTDNVGSAEKNDKLSTVRAKAVNDYLVAKGIDQSRLRFEGFGEDRPVADNATVGGRSKNRRVEMKLK